MRKPSRYPGVVANPHQVSPEKRLKQAIMREHGVSGKRARKLMKAAKRRAKAEGPPPRPIPPDTPGRPVLPHRPGAEVIR